MPWFFSDKQDKIILYVKIIQNKEKCACSYKLLQIGRKNKFLFSPLCHQSTQLSYAVIFNWEKHFIHQIKILSFQLARPLSFSLSYMGTSRGISL